MGQGHHFYLRDMRKGCLYCLFIFIFFITSINLYGQKKHHSFIRYTDDQIPEITKLVDSVEIQKYIQDHLTNLHSGGFAFALIDTIQFLHDSCFISIFKGKKYTFGKLNLHSDHLAVIEEAGLKPQLLKGKTIDSIRIQSYLKTLLNHYNNTGYPFASVALDSARFQNDVLEANLLINKGKLINFDSIALEGRLDMKPHFFSRFLDLKKGERYAHNKILRASTRIRDLPYIQQRSEPFVRFVNDKAILVLTPDPKPASRFDFLIGVLPQVTNGVRKWNLSVDFTAEMNNTLRNGEYTFIQVKRLKPENLELQLKSSFPYVAKLPVGTHFDFRLFKNGTKNIDLFFDGGIQYLFGGNNQLRIFGSYRSSSLLDVNLDEIIAAKKLPSALDVTYSGAGMGIIVRQLDYRFNPTKGYSIELSTVLGRKKIIPNRQIIDLESFANSYDTLKLSSLQGEINGAAAYFIKVKNWATIKTGMTGGWKYNDQKLQTNELMRIGGNKILRGFDEESIFTDFYAFGTAEFRIIFDQNSYLSLPFVDFGYIGMQNSQTTKSIPVLGLGMGLNIGTSAGVFNVSFAAGKQGDAALDFSRMKIHFGYVNLF